MAFLLIDKKRMELTVMVGVLEKYTPDKKIKQLHKEVEDLRLDFESHLFDIIGEKTDSQKALEILNSDPEKQKKWDKYLSEDYVEKLKKIQSKIDEKNLVLCPNLKLKDK